MQKSVHAHVDAHVHAHVYPHVHLHGTCPPYTCPCTCPSLHACLYTCLGTCLCTCLYTCLYTCFYNHVNEHDEYRHVHTQKTSRRRCRYRAADDADLGTVYLAVCVRQGIAMTAYRHRPRHAHEEAVISSTGAPLPAQRTCRRRCRCRAADEAGLGIVYLPVCVRQGVDRARLQRLPLGII